MLESFSFGCLVRCGEHTHQRISTTVRPVFDVKPSASHALLALPTIDVRLCWPRGDGVAALEQLAERDEAQLLHLHCRRDHRHKVRE